MKMEHRSAEYTKVNPLNLIPALYDNGVYISDSHAIAIYMIEKYAKDDSLYPKDILKRTKVNQMLFFESSILFQKYYEMASPLFRGLIREFSEYHIANTNRAYGFINGFLSSGQTYLCGDTMTLADINIWCTLLSLNFMVPIDGEKHPLLMKWLNLMKTHPCYELNIEGAKKHYALIKLVMDGGRKNFEIKKE